MSLCPRTIALRPWLLLDGVVLWLLTFPGRRCRMCQRQGPSEDAVPGLMTGVAQKEDLWYDSHWRLSFFGCMAAAFHDIWLAFSFGAFGV